MSNYHYPLDPTWSKQEIIDVVHFFALIERAYEGHVNRDELLSSYNKFKQIVPSKSEEKTYFTEFKKASGYASFPVVKKARNNTVQKITMN